MPEIIESKPFCLDDLQFDWQAKNLLQKEVFTPVLKRGYKMVSINHRRYRGKTLFAWFKYWADGLAAETKVKIETLSPKCSDKKLKLIQFRFTFP